jgi:ergothioneine biosynthesis protein EgtB
VLEIASYREAIDECILQLLTSVDDLTFSELAPLLILGLNHEQQHQELILTDYQHARLLNPDLPRAWPGRAGERQSPPMSWLDYQGGLVETGYAGESFFFDNEGPRHKYWLEPYSLANRPVINAEFLAFIEDGGYQNPLLWFADGWAWLQNNEIDKPLYWTRDGDEWQRNSHAARECIEIDQPLVNISFYEASAFANWYGARLPTEHEWEHAMSAGSSISQPYITETAEIRVPCLVPAAETGLWLGNTWEWTASPYVAYPGFQPGAGSVGEYNGKFMSNQLVLKGFSGFTSSGHSRPSYRNFFYPHARWQQTGLRLAMDLKA